MNTEIATMLLKDAGLIVDTAENGAVGLSKFSASSEHYYDLLLMEIRMPIMDGYEATKAIRALKRSDAKSTPIIAMTADAFEESLRLPCRKDGTEEDGKKRNHVISQVSKNAPLPRGR